MESLPSPQDDHDSARSRLLSGESLTSDQIDSLFDSCNSIFTDPVLRPSKHVQYFAENELSGDFHALRGGARAFNGTFQHRDLNLILSHDRRSNSGGPLVNATETQSVWRALVTDAPRILVMMFLGVIAGFCWMISLQLLGKTSTTARSSAENVLLCSYAAGTNRSRQLFFVAFKYPPPRNLHVVILILMLLCHSLHRVYCCCEVLWCS